MNKNEVLNKIYNKEIKKRKAYKILFKKKKVKKARFIKLNVKVEDEKFVNAFLKVLFILPFPISLIKVFIKRKEKINIKDDISLSGKEVSKLLSVKGVEIRVDSKSNANVLIKTI